jgi:hypothetical protein
MARKSCQKNKKRDDIYEVHIHRPNFCIRWRIYPTNYKTYPMSERG